ncbi:MAG: AAA family ATPase, partial [Cyanobium sp.]
MARADATQRHGGNLAAAARQLGRRPGSLLDASASLVPFGPPLALRLALVRAVAGSPLRAYPDRDWQDLRRRLAELHGLPPLTTRLDDQVEAIGRVLLGKEQSVRLALSCLLAGGHLRLEDLPGTGKTTLAEALARSFGLDFRRVSFTSDLLPADLTGINVLDPASGSFRFQPGPLFTQVLLADEINRASPRTQSALLEAMASGRVSVDGTSHPLPRPFMVIATQNSLDQVGTAPLP